MAALSTQMGFDPLAVRPPGTSLPTTSGDTATVTRPGTPAPGPTQPGSSGAVSTGSSTALQALPAPASLSGLGTSTSTSPALQGFESGLSPLAPSALPQSLNTLDAASVTAPQGANLRPPGGSQPGSTTGSIRGLATTSRFSSAKAISRSAGSLSGYRSNQTYSRANSTGQRTDSYSNTRFSSAYSTAANLGRKYPNSGISAATARAPTVGTKKTTTASSPRGAAPKASAGGGDFLGDVGRVLNTNLGQLAVSGMRSAGAPTQLTEALDQGFKGSERIMRDPVGAVIGVGKNVAGSLQEPGGGFSVGSVARGLGTLAVESTIQPVYGVVTSRGLINGEPRNPYEELANAFVIGGGVVGGFAKAGGAVRAGEAATARVGSAVRSALEDGAQLGINSGARRIRVPSPNAPAPLPSINKNAASTLDPTHLYRIDGPDGLYKVGISSRGVRAGDSASIRAEEQARRLTRSTGDFYRSTIIRQFPNRAEALKYESELIRRYASRYGARPPGNKVDR